MPSCQLINEILPVADASLRWMRTLVDLGAWVTAFDPSLPLTVAVCLPRVEFVGLLVASGACLQATQSSVPENWQPELGKLVGRRVAYSLRGKNPHVYWEGILCEPDPSDLAMVRIQGTKDGHPDVWSLADLFSVQLDPERDGQPLQSHLQSKKAFKDERSGHLRTLLPENAVGKLCSWWLQLTLVGIRNRLSEELNEMLPFMPESPTGCTFADLLRPEGDVTDSVIMRLLSAKDLTGECARGVVIIEGSRRLSEHLTATQRHHRIVLLGRNEPHYSDCAEIVTSLFQQRSSDVAEPGFDCPEHMKMKMFHH